MQLSLPATRGLWVQCLPLSGWASTADHWNTLGNPLKCWMDIYKLSACCCCCFLSVILIWAGCLRYRVVQGSGPGWWLIPSRVGVSHHLRSLHCPTSGEIGSVCDSSSAPIGAWSHRHTYRPVNSPVHSSTACVTAYKWAVPKKLFFSFFKISLTPSVDFHLNWRQTPEH